MSFAGTQKAITNNQLTKILNNPEILYDIFNSKGNNLWLSESCDLLRYILTDGKMYGDDDLLLQSIYGINLIDKNEEICYPYPMTYSTPEQVKMINKKLSSISEADLLSKINIADINKKVKSGDIFWFIKYKDKNEVADDILRPFQDLKVFYKNADDNNFAVLTQVG